jgi:uncharacterized protein (TIGR02466 family)
MTSHSHRSFGIPEPDNIEFDEIDGIDIFPTVLFSCKVCNIDNDLIIKQCFDLSENHESVNKSNIGGWQSPVYTTEDISIHGELSSIIDLSYRAIEFSNLIVEDLKSTALFDKRSPHFWININKNKNYNVIHSHPKCDLIVIYYPIIKENQGGLHLVRADGSIHHLLYEGTNYSPEFAFQPKPGYFYAFPSHILHYVDPNESNEPRISISFNMSAS